MPNEAQPPATRSVAWQATPEAVDASGDVTRFSDTGIASTVEGSTLALGTGGGLGCSGRPPFCP